MIALIAGMVHAAAAVAPAAPMVWFDEDFELPSYENRAQLYGVWGVDPAGRAAVRTERGLVMPGSYSFMEDSGAGTRHIRVFDPTDSVDGTDECPLRFKYMLHIKQYSAAATTRYCEIFNSRTGARIGLGPARSSNRYQVFDGVQWRDLQYSVWRVWGWTSLEIIVKTHTLEINIVNHGGLSSETVPRLVSGGFGSFAVGSANKNDKTATCVDNIVLDGGIVVRQGGNEKQLLAPQGVEPLVAQQVAEALLQVKQGKPQQSVEALEAILRQMNDKIAEGNEAARMTIPWVYEAIGAAKEALEVSPQELMAVHYEAIAKSPNGIGADVAVRRLAAPLNGLQRTRLLLNISQRDVASMAGLEAARLLVESSVKESKTERTQRLRKCIAEAPGTLVPEAVVEAVLANGTGEQNERLTMRYVIEAVADQPIGQELLAKYGERLARVGQKLAERQEWDQLQKMVDWVVKQRINSCTSMCRKLLFESRMQRRDVFGALAAISDYPLGDEKAMLLKALAEEERVDRIRQLLNDLTARVLNGNYEIAPRSKKGYIPGVSENVLWEAIASAAEDSGLPRVAVAAYHTCALDGKPVSACDGSPLSMDFALKDAQPEEIVALWKAHSLSSGNRPGIVNGGHRIIPERLGEAGQILESLMQSTSPVLQAQAAFDLARIRQRQHRPKSAMHPLSVCEKLLPTSQAVRDLKASIDRDMRRQEESHRLHKEVGQAWAKAAQEKDSKDIAAALLKVAEIEMQLGVPERAAEALEGVVAKYENAPTCPVALNMLAGVYEKHLNKTEESQKLRERLAKQFPSYVGTQNEAN